MDDRTVERIAEQELDTAKRSAYVKSCEEDSVDPLSYHLWCMVGRPQHWMDAK